MGVCSSAAATAVKDTTTAELRSAATVTKEPLAPAKLVAPPAPEPAYGSHVRLPTAGAKDDAQFKMCPACGIYIEKLSGGDTMMCGCEARSAGGTYEKALAAGGCGHEFQWSTLAPIACGKPGAPANDRQVLFGTGEFAPPPRPAEPRRRSAPSKPTKRHSSLPDTIKTCPACGVYIEKLDGDDNMMCGCEARPAGGTYEKALAGGGCGHEFKWSTLEPVDCGKPGAPANERQINFFNFHDVVAEVSPDYWRGERLARVEGKYNKVFDELLNATYIAKSTQDRLCPTGEHSKTPGGCPCVQPFLPDDVLAAGVQGLPIGYRVQQVIRNQDPQMWAKYAAKRSEIRERRRGEAFRELNPSLLTSKIAGQHPSLFGPPDAKANEAYLLHGTPVTSALEILQNDFNVRMPGRAGSAMYGNGVYLCESSTKADEYSKDYPATDLEGTFAMIICRVTLGKFYYTTERDSSAGSKVTKGHYDSTVGDRAKSAGTFREFVVYNDRQVYPEYLVIYHRVHAGDSQKDIDKRLNAQLDFGLKSRADVQRGRATE